MQTIVRHNMQLHTSSEPDMVGNYYSFKFFNLKLNFSFIPAGYILFEFKI